MASPSEAIPTTTPLHGLKLSELKRRALAAGVTQEQLDDADDADDDTHALVMALLHDRAGAGTGPQAASTAAWSSAALAEELRGLKLSVLKKHAIAAGVQQAALDTADDGPAEEVHAVVVALLLAQASVSPSSRITATCPALLPVLGPVLCQELELALASCSEGGNVIGSDAAWWLRVELTFVLRLLVLRVSDELAKLVLESAAADRRPDSELPYAAVTAPQLERRHALCSSLLAQVEAATAKAVAAATRGDGAGFQPLFHAVVAAYSLPGWAAQALQFIVLAKVQRGVALRTLLADCECTQHSTRPAHPPASQQYRWLSLPHPTYTFWPYRGGRRGIKLLFRGGAGRALQS
jgi:hypothetical protein